MKSDIDGATVSKKQHPPPAATESSIPENGNRIATPKELIQRERERERETGNPGYHGSMACHDSSDKLGGAARKIN